MRIIATLAGLLGFCILANAQSFNIDLDAGIGDQQSGNGAPNSTFGGAANNPGFWNRIDAGTDDPGYIADLGGQLTGVHMWATGGLGSGGGDANHNNTGDYALLLNDFAEIGGQGENDYHYSGLAPGRYAVYTYAVNAQGHRVQETVTVPGADDPVQYVTGPMPGNQFIQGITHSIHYLTLNSGDNLTIEIQGSGVYPEVNGFQIVAVPETGGYFVLLAGLVALAFLRPVPEDRGR